MNGRGSPVPSVSVSVVDSVRAESVRAGSVRANSGRASSVRANSMRAGSLRAASPSSVSQQPSMYLLFCFKHIYSFT